MKTIGDKIKEYRKKAGLTQEQLAMRLNVTFQTVSKWETNASSPDLSMIIPLTRLFGISADELLGLNDAEPDARYAELMAEDEQLMSMQDWLNETDRFLTNNRRNVLDGKGHISREAAAKKVGAIYEEFRKKQDAAYISEFDRQTEQYLKGECE